MKSNQAKHPEISNGYCAGQSPVLQTRCIFNSIFSIRCSNLISRDKTEVLVNNQIAVAVLIGLVGCCSDNPSCSRAAVASVTQRNGQPGAGFLSFPGNAQWLGN